MHSLPVGAEVVFHAEAAVTVTVMTMENDPQEEKEQDNKKTAKVGEEINSRL